ncbi:MAG: rod shape-determining protein MreD [Thermodesulfovibrionales bacterium]
MKVFIFIFLVLSAFVVQSKVSIMGIPPALTVIAPYYMGLREGARKGMITGSLIGMIEDSLSGNVLGPHLLGKGLIGFSSSLFSGSLFRWTPLLGIIGLFSLTVIDGLTIFITKTIFNIQFIPVSRLITTVLFQGILNSLAGIFLRPENAE